MKLTFRFGLRSRLYTLRRPDAQLWSQSEIALTGWPILGGHECKQARVRGIMGDRVNRNFLVVQMRDGKMIVPSQKHFIGEDPEGL